jgi:3-deoxy-D-manno-octulosonate 8-phosphate phosphatase (KDO 8-P phosphatase)
MIKLIVIDVDGTLTDGKIYMGSDGEVLKVFNIKDGCGIHDILIPAGITPIIMTGRSSKILEKRCNELGITEIYQGVSDKPRKLAEVVNCAGCDYSNVAYIGDDINDIGCMQLIKEAGGDVGCPADAVKAVKAIANFISLRKGGDGAVREFIEWLVCNEDED